MSPRGTIAAGGISIRRDDEVVVTRLHAEMDEFNRGPTQGGRGRLAVPGRRRARLRGRVGLLAAAVILLLAFGSVVAMGLPIITAIVGIVAGLAGVQLWAAVVQTPSFTVQVASMIGIGVGIDYALFIVTRYREALREHGDVEAAVVTALSTRRARRRCSPA